jgi:hypothetical protein
MLLISSALCQEDVNLPGKFSRTSLAASTLAGEFRSGTSADNNEMTEISCTSAGGSHRLVGEGNLRQSRRNVRVTTSLLHLHIPIHHPLVRATRQLGFQSARGRKLTSIDIQTSPFLSLVE